MSTLTKNTTIYWPLCTRLSSDNTLIKGTSTEMKTSTRFCKHNPIRTTQCIYEIPVWTLGIGWNLIPHAHSGTFLLLYWLYLFRLKYGRNWFYCSCYPEREASALKEWLVKWQWLANCHQVATDFICWHAPNFDWRNTNLVHNIYINRCQLENLILMGLSAMSNIIPWYKICVRTAVEG